MSTKWKWILSGVGVVLAAAFGGLSYMAGSPRDAYGMVRYALPHMHRGKLHAGDDAPDAQVLALDGQQRFHLRERMRDRPLVLVFGSYT
jgi:Iodothyronine deiodinase